jgi:hypothetical protein
MIGIAQFRPLDSDSDDLEELFLPEEPFLDIFEIRLQ